MTGVVFPAEYLVGNLFIFFGDMSVRISCVVLTVLFIIEFVMYIVKLLEFNERSDLELFPPVLWLIACLPNFLKLSFF